MKEGSRGGERENRIREVSGRKREEEGVFGIKRVTCLSCVCSVSSIFSWFSLILLLLRNTQFFGSRIRSVFFRSCEKNFWHHHELASPVSRDKNRNHKLTCFSYFVLSQVYTRDSRRKREKLNPISSSISTSVVFVFPIKSNIN